MKNDSLRIALCCLTSLAIASFSTVTLHADESPFVQVGTVTDDDINESSGLCRSLENAGWFWTHNDSGDKPRLFLIDDKGVTQSTVRLRGADAVDWEDICSFEMDDQNWLAVGDIGDNANNREVVRPECRVYLLKEPTGNLAHRTTAKVDRVIRLHLEFGPHDCESLAFDPVAKQLLLFSRDFKPNETRLYSVPLDLKNPVKHNETVLAKALADVSMPLVSGMDISPDGRRMVLATPLVGLLIERTADEDWSQAILRPQKPIPLPPRKQGESICFGKNAGQVFLTSERRQQPLWRVDLKK